MPPLAQAQELMFSDVSSSESASTTAGSPYSDFLPFPDVPLDFQSEQSAALDLPVLTHANLASISVPVPKLVPASTSEAVATKATATVAVTAIDALFGTATPQATEHALSFEELSWPTSKSSSTNSHLVGVTKPNSSSGAGIGRRDRPYVCKAAGCTKSFAKKWNLQAHERLHTGYKPFTCRRGCGEQLMWKSSQRSHERRKCPLIPENLRFKRKPRTRRTNPDSHLSFIAHRPSFNLPQQLPAPESIPRSVPYSVPGSTPLLTPIPNMQENIVSELENILASTSDTSNFPFPLWLLKNYPQPGSRTY